MEFVDAAQQWREEKPTPTPATQSVIARYIWVERGEYYLRVQLDDRTFLVIARKGIRPKF
jgi:hypothetical protein